MAEILTEFPDTGNCRTGHPSRYEKYCDGRVWALKPSEFGYPDTRDGQARLQMALRTRAHRTLRRVKARSMMDGTVVVQITPKP